MTVAAPALESFSIKFAMISRGHGHWPNRLIDSSSMAATLTAESPSARGDQRWNASNSKSRRARTAKGSVKAAIPQRMIGMQLIKKPTGPSALLACDRRLSLDRRAFIFPRIHTFPRRGKKATAANFIRRKFHTYFILSLKHSISPGLALHPSKAYA